MEEDFELDTFLSENLRIKKYNKDENNYYLSYHTDKEVWFINLDREKQTQFIYFEDIHWSVPRILTNVGITMRELQEYYRYLGWI